MQTSGTCGELTKGTHKPFPSAALSYEGTTRHHKRENTQRLPRTGRPTGKTNAATEETKRLKGFSVSATGTTGSQKKRRQGHNESEPHCTDSAAHFRWGTRTRTRKDRTRICSVTITPYPNRSVTSVVTGAKVGIFFLTAKLYPHFFSKNDRHQAFSHPHYIKKPAHDGNSLCAGTSEGAREAGLRQKRKAR